METLPLDAIPIGNIVKYKNGEKHYEVLSDFKLRKLDNSEIYQGSPSAQFYIIKENNMKIYKENEEVTFVIGKETIIGRVTPSHVSMRGCTNYEVFNKLGIEGTMDITVFCSKHYGYPAKSGGWPTCKSGDYESLSRLIHALQELCDKHNDKSTQKFSVGDKVRITGNHPDPHKFAIGEIVTIKGCSPTGSRYHCTNQKESWMVNIDCCKKVEDTIIQEPKVGDWVKCISHSNQWSRGFIIGKAYQILDITESSYFIRREDNTPLYVQKIDFMLCNEEPIQNDSEWKVGDTLEYIREGNYDWGLNDCTVGDAYTIIAKHPKLGHPVIYDDVDDKVTLTPEELKCFKIINNQKQQSYVKDNSNNSFELPSSSPAISARQTARGGIVSSSDLEIWI